MEPPQLRSIYKKSVRSRERDGATLFQSLLTDLTFLDILAALSSADKAG
jgi:hypothetical protein